MTNSRAAGQMAVEQQTMGHVITLYAVRGCARKSDLSDQSEPDLFRMPVYRGLCIYIYIYIYI